MVPDLSVELCGVPLPGPLLLGSGGLGESAETLAPFQEVACAAVVTRTLRGAVRPGRERFPSPHVTVGPRRNWLLNSEWGNLRPLSYWVETGIAEAAARGPVIASVSGRDRDDCARTCAVLDNRPISLIEINVSCSHAGLAFGRLTDDADHVARVVDAARRACSVPVVVKLGAGPTLASVARAAVDAGAAAIAVTNSIGPGLDVDIETGRPKLGNAGGYGGMSGPAIFPIALECVREVVDAVTVPVVGVGGVSSADDVVKMLMVGARCVQIYTAAALHGPRVFDRVTEGLRRYLVRHGHPGLDSVRGAATRYLRRPTNVEPLIPRVDPDRCRPCPACGRVCPADAIELDGWAHIRADRCTGCGLCVESCPPQRRALSLPD